MIVVMVGRTALHIASVLRRRVGIWSKEQDFVALLVIILDTSLSVCGRNFKKEHDDDEGQSLAEKIDGSSFKISRLCLVAELISKFLWI